MTPRLSFTKEKELCIRDGICLVDGMIKQNKVGTSVVDKCPLTGARCYAKKCPKFPKLRSGISPTELLGNYGLEEQYKEEMGE